MARPELADGVGGGLPGGVSRHVGRATDGRGMTLLARCDGVQVFSQCLHLLVFDDFIAVFVDVFVRELHELAAF